MIIYGLSEQLSRPDLAQLSAVAEVMARPLTDLIRQGWDRPLVVLGDVLETEDGQALLRLAPRAVAPLLVMPPLPRGEITTQLNAPAPVTIVHHLAEQIGLANETLRATLRRDHLTVYCTDAIETALQSGVLATAESRPVIWSYQPTHTATPIVISGAQLLLISARTDPLDREDLLAVLLDWADMHTRVTPIEPAQRTASTATVDPGLLRALIVAWSVRPDLELASLAAWLRHTLFVDADDATLRTAAEQLRAEGMLDTNLRPQADAVEQRVSAWNLRAWVREASRRQE